MTFPFVSMGKDALRWHGSSVRYIERGIAGIYCTAISQEVDAEQTWPRLRISSARTWPLTPRLTLSCSSCPHPGGWWMDAVTGAQTPAATSTSALVKTAYAHTQKRRKIHTRARDRSEAPLPLTLKNVSPFARAGWSDLSTGLISGGLPAGCSSSLGHKSSASVSVKSRWWIHLVFF